MENVISRRFKYELSNSDDIDSYYSTLGISLLIVPDIHAFFNSALGVA